MLNEKEMTFKNDIFSLGVILLVLLYKILKLFINNKLKIFNEDIQVNKKKIIKYIVFLKEINKLREEIEDESIKYKLLEYIEKIFKTLPTEKKNDDYIKINEFYISKFNIYKKLINECLKEKPNINEIKKKYYFNINE